MLKPRTPTDPAATRSKLDDAVAAVRREAEGAESDPFDEAMVAVVTGLAEAIKAESAALEAAGAQVGRVARKLRHRSSG